MRYYIVYITLALLSVSSISCRQNEGRIGPLFGKWQLKEVQSENAKEVYDSIFYNFQWEYVELQRLRTEHGVYRTLGYFSHEGDELILTIRNRTKLDVIAGYALPDTLVVFKVRELTNRSMVLQLDDETVYRFRKFGIY